MTDESEDKTLPWIEKHGARYPYAYMSKGARSSVAKALGWRGFPGASLIAPDGTVVWTGHPASLSAGTIEKHLRGADRTPVAVRAVSRKWPEEAEKVVKALTKADYKGALKAADKLDQELREQITADLMAMVDKRAGKLKALHDKGDYLGFQMAWGEQKKSFKGLDAEDDLEDLDKTLKKDKSIKAQLKAQQALFSVKKKMSGSLSREERTRTIKQIESIIEDHSGTFVHGAGRKMIEGLRAKRR